MFRQIRYQTGEIEEITEEMKKGNIPCMDVDNSDEFEWFVQKLSQHGIYRVEGLPYNKGARDGIVEPEFEFRTAFFDKPLKADDLEEQKLMYIDFYFEPFIEKDYDSIFGD